jgi:hypothetical protein
MFSFQHYKVHNMLAMMLDPCYKWLGVVNKVKKHYDRQKML